MVGSSAWMLDVEAGGYRICLVWVHDGSTCRGVQAWAQAQEEVGAGWPQGSVPASNASYLYNWMPPVHHTLPLQQTICYW